MGFASLQCAFCLHVVSLGRKLCTCVRNFLQNEGVNGCLVLCLGKMEVIDMVCLAGTNSGSGRKRKGITSLANR